MTALNPGRIALQVHIALIRAGATRCLIALTLVLGAGTWIWIASHASEQEERQERALAEARRALEEASASGGVAQGSAAERNLHDFYAALGDASEAERHLKTLFAVAAETGVQLDQGEYKWEFEKNSRTYRYQILLPVKGPYGVLRRFCEESLLALPFASLDELTFKRESIGEDATDGSLRFTVYLEDRPRALKKAGAERS